MLINHPFGFVSILLNAGIFVEKDIRQNFSIAFSFIRTVRIGLWDISLDMSPSDSIYLISI